MFFLSYESNMLLFFSLQTYPKNKVPICISNLSECMCGYIYTTKTAEMAEQA
jgi:hypothetical protein